MRTLPPPGWADAACSRPRKTESAPRWPLSHLGRFAFGAIYSQRNGDGTPCCVRPSPTAPDSSRQARARDRLSSTLFPACVFRWQRPRGYAIDSLRRKLGRDAGTTLDLPRGHATHRLRRWLGRDAGSTSGRERMRFIAFGATAGMGLASEGAPVYALYGMCGLPWHHM